MAQCVAWELHDLVRLKLLGSLQEQPLDLLDQAGYARLKRHNALVIE